LGAQNILFNHLKPNLGHIDVCDFKEEHWKRYAKAFYSQNPTGKLFNKRKLMMKILNYARKKNLVQESFTLAIDDAPEREGRVLTDLELAGILKHTTSRTLPLQVRIARYMGMRKDEVLALRRDEVDVINRVINLDRPDTKTKHHKRSMAIAPEVLGGLLLQLQSHTEPEVFPSRESGAQKDNHANWDRAVKAARAAGDFEGHATFHDLRHSFITQKLLVEKHSIVDVSEYVGTSVEILQERYIHHKAEHTRHLVEAAGAKKRGRA
jgi:integrase